MKSTSASETAVQKHCRGRVGKAKVGFRSSCTLAQSMESQAVVAESSVDAPQNSGPMGRASSSPSLVDLILPISTNGLKRDYTYLS